MKCTINVIESPQNHHPSSGLWKIVLHKTGPWYQKRWDQYLTRLEFRVLYSSVIITHQGESPGLVLGSPRTAAMSDPRLLLLCLAQRLALSSCSINTP